MFEKYLTESVENEILSKVEDELVINLKDYTLGQIKESYRQHFINELDVVVDKVVSEIVARGFKNVTLNRIVRNVLNELTLEDVEQENEHFTYFRLVGDGAVNKSIGFVYADYCEWCDVREITPLSKIKFSKEFQLATGLTSKTTSVNGKSVRVYAKES